MLTDYQATLSNAQALTATAASTNLYDSSAAYDISRGEPLGVMITVDVAADSTTGDETYSFAVQTDDNTGFSSAKELIAKTVAAADLGAGAIVILPFHTGMEQYTRVNYTLGGTTPSVTVTAEVKPLCDIQTFTSNLPSGYTVSF